MIWAGFCKLLFIRCLKRRKIQGTYFKISALYFKIYALCFFAHGLCFFRCPVPCVFSCMCVKF